MTSQEEQELNQWVMEYVAEGTDWLCTPPRRGRLVAMRIHGFRGSGPDMTGQYDIEISFFLVKQKNGTWTKVGVNERDSLPPWFLAEMRRPGVSSYSPGHIWAKAFKSLVDSHRITSTQMIRYTLDV